MVMTISKTLFNFKNLYSIFVAMILVTGGTGLVGAHLLLHLLQNEATSLRAIYRNSKQVEKTKRLFEQANCLPLFDLIEWVKADVLEVPSLEIAFQDIDYVYHCAALISFDPNDEQQLRKVNIEGTANIVNFCIDKKVQKLCYVSSIAALGDLSQNQVVITEETEWNPEVLHSDYAISKYGAEMEVWRAHQEGLAVVIVNPGVILGAGFWKQGSGLFFTQIKKGFPFYTQGSTAYVSVQDVVNIMMQLMNSDCNGERFIVIAENKSYKEVIVEIANKIGAVRPRINATSWLLNVAWRLDWLVSKVFRTKRKISKHGSMSLLNKDQIANAKIINYLNYSFQSVNDCIAEVSKEFKNNTI